MNDSTSHLLAMLLVGFWTLATANTATAQQPQPSQSTETATVGAQDEWSSEQLDFFENRIRPLLTEHCLECHGADPDKIRGGLWLTSRQQMLNGGDSGPAVVPGKPAESLLIEAVHYDGFEMPPSGQLDNELIGWLEKWITDGAADPRSPSTAAATSQTAPTVEEGRQFWAFQAVDPPVRPTLTSDWSADWSESPIDEYLAARMELEGLRPVEDTDRATLLRRVYFVLTGLPPDADQLDSFCSSQRPIAEDLETVVDRLLDSPEFGQRWGRHWLDVARFAESSGGGRSLMFPEAWRYRDYVIDAYNQDKPLPQFITEQLAGDLLPYDSLDQRNEQLVATGFLALGPTNYEQQDKERLRLEVIDEQVDTTGRAFLALTLGCARCHDHKFDPIPTSDYYAMAGIFGSTVALVDGNVSSPVMESLATEAQQAAMKQYREQVKQLDQQLKQAQQQLQRLTGKDTAAGKRDRRQKSADLDGIVVDDLDAEVIGNWVESVSVPQYVDAGYRHDDNQGQGSKQIIFRPQLEQGGHYEVRLAYSAGGNRASNVKVVIDHQDGQATKRINQAQDPELDGLFVSLGKFRFEANNVCAVTVSNEDADGYVIADAVQFLPVSQTARSDTNRKPQISDGGSPKNDQAESAKVASARKKVERLDQALRELKQNAPRPLDQAMVVKDAKEPCDGHIHIRGSVRNLGPEVQRGFLKVVSEPSRWPEIPSSQSGRLQLAQWIASPDNPLTSRVYVNRIWRHVFGKGLVLTTDNFGSMGQRPSHPELLDYLANRFVQQGWSTKQLIRELVLSRVFRLSSNLASKSAQQAVDIDPENRLLCRAHRRRVDAEFLRDSILFASGELDPTPGGLTIRKITQYDLSYVFDSNRRSVYVPAFRNSILDLFEVFDRANPNLVVGDRNASTLPTQALFLMNSDWVQQQASAAATRLVSESETTEQRILLAYRRILGRQATPRERQLTLDYVGSFADSGNSQDAAEKAWTSIVHSLFNSLDFRYVH